PGCAPRAVQVLRAAQASRQSRRACPPPPHVRLHLASWAVQVLGHVAATAPRVAASASPTNPARTSAGRCDRLASVVLCETSTLRHAASPSLRLIRARSPRLRVGASLAGTDVPSHCTHLPM